MKNTTETKEYTKTGKYIVPNILASILYNYFNRRG